ncbi:MAG: PIN domain nuclease [Verrucomicrobia bacterium]|nr:PIN domain nuclease [Verrucomicrobiota bacterium]
MVIVDTSIWVDFLKGRESAGATHLEQLLDDEVDVFTSGIIVQELLTGIKEKKTRNEVKKDLGLFITVMPSLGTHVQAAEIYDGCRKKGITIRSIVDCLIAALAIEYDLTVLQSDRDYVGISQVYPLKLETYE